MTVPPPQPPQPIQPPQPTAPPAPLQSPAPAAPPAPYGYPYPYQGYQPYPPSPYVPPAPIPPARKPRTGLWVAIAVIAFVVLTAVAAGTVYYVGRRNTPSANPSAAIQADPSAIPPPADGDRQSVWNDWAEREAERIVQVQAQALLTGDEAGYVAAVDPDEPRLLKDLRDRFEVLTTMGIGQWTQDLSGDADPTDDRAWHALLKVQYCFGETTCRLNPLTFGTDWRYADGRLVLTGVDTSDASQVGPRPWETNDVAVATGERVVVGTSNGLKWRLDQTVTDAEEAVAVADKFARWADPPSRYVAFVANGDDWDDWYGNQVRGVPDWAAGGYFQQIDNEVLINADVVTTGQTFTFLAHEFTHASSLAGPRLGLTSSAWWLIEGIAVYAEMLGKEPTQYDVGALTAMREFVGAGGDWDGNVRLGYPGGDATTAAIYYAVAYLATLRIAQVYGEEAMLTFWGSVIHEGHSVEDASQSALGQRWDIVAADCATYVRSI